MFVFCLRGCYDNSPPGLFGISFSLHLPALTISGTRQVMISSLRKKKNKKIKHMPHPEADEPSMTKVSFLRANNLDDTLNDGSEKPHCSQLVITGFRLSYQNFLLSTFLLRVWMRNTGLSRKQKQYHLYVHAIYVAELPHWFYYLLLITYHPSIE